MTRRYADMNQHDALYKLARAYPGGIDALAKAMDMSPNVLRNKLAPGIASHHVSFEEASQIIHLCQEAGVKGALLPVHALLSRHGMSGFVVPTAGELSTDELSQMVCRVMAQIGELAGAVSAAFEDGICTESEVDLIEREFQGALAVLGNWRARIRQHHETHSHNHK
ncbi:MAG TPA: phage regulatory CII family protein [Candidatus Acidoferrum sp.]|nr:phage regulatory CII family protein [Candidatus Acidoferrum sp.]